MHWLKKWASSLGDLIYPPLCLHCHALLPNSSIIFCNSCLTQMEVINPEERCKICFSYLGNEKSCQVCLKQPPRSYDRLASVFDYEGPPATLIRQLKYSKKPYLAKGASAYLAFQILQLNWPIPDYFIPVPLSFSHWLERGYNQSELLTDALAEHFQRPKLNAILRKSGDYSQAELSQTQRIKLSKNSFALKNTICLREKIIILLDDITTTGTTINRCAEVLAESFPAAIYCLTFCKTIK